MSDIQAQPVSNESQNPVKNPSMWFKPGNQLAKGRGRPRLDAQLREALRATALDNVATLVEIRDNKKNPANVRMACANSLLDRGFGKPREMKEDLVQEAQELLADEALQSLLE